MKTTDIARFALALLAAVAGSWSLQVFAASNESFVLNPDTGNYTVTYLDSFGTLQRVVWIPATKIVPAVTSRFKEQGALVLYRYRIRNERKSDQNVSSAGVTVLTMEAGSQRIPRGWTGAEAPDVKSGTGYHVGWWEDSDDPLAGIGPEHALDGFGVDSPALPGVGTMQLMGGTPLHQGFPGEGPDPTSSIGKQFYAVYDHNYVIRNVAVPLVDVPTPFDVASVLIALKKHVDKDLVGMNLIDPALVARLDPLFQSAIAAAKGGNDDALRADLHALRKVLNNEREKEDESENADRECEIDDTGQKSEVSRNHPVATIAKAVLEFDLRYLERRLTKKDQIHGRNAKLN